MLGSKLIRKIYYIFPGTLGVLFLTGMFVLPVLLEVAAEDSIKKNNIAELQANIETIAKFNWVSPEIKAMHKFYSVYAEYLFVKQQPVIQDTRGTFIAVQVLKSKIANSRNELVNSIFYRFKIPQFEKKQALLFKEVVTFENQKLAAERQKEFKNAIEYQLTQKQKSYELLGRVLVENEQKVKQNK